MNRALVTIVEDDEIQRKLFKKHLLKRFGEFSEFIDIIAVDSISEVVQTFIRKEVKVYIVDINLGKGKDEEGIDIIKLIKSKFPNALIIAYSAYTDKKQKCIEAGASLFMKKSAKNYEEDLLQIVRIVKSNPMISKQKEELKSTQNNKKINTLFGKIDLIQDDFITLYCYIGKSENGKNIFHTKKYLRAMFSTFTEDDLFIGTPVKIEVFLSEHGDLTYSASKPEAREFPEDLFRDSGEPFFDSPLGKID